MNNIFRLSDDRLYWQVDANDLNFKTTKDVKHDDRVFGQQVAKDALSFAIECHSSGFNAYVRGLSGSGRKTLVRNVFKDLKPTIRQKRDYCYVHNFTHPNKPRLIVLPGGFGKLFKQMMASFADYISNDLPEKLNSEKIRLERKQVEEKTNKAVETIYRPLEKKLAELGLGLVNIKEENQTRMVIAPVYDNRVLSQAELEQLIQQGQFDKDKLAAYQRLLPELQSELLSIAAKANAVIEASFADIQAIDNEFARKQLHSHLNVISKKFANAELDIYLAEIIDHFIKNIFHHAQQPIDAINLYGVNILNEPFRSDEAPIVFEASPTLMNFIGTVETEGRQLPYASISAGTLIAADGGFLVIPVDEALRASGAWLTLMRTLRSGQLSFSFEDKPDGRPVIVQPDPIPLDIKVILVGSHQRYHELKAYDIDFDDQFKILVDLNTELDRKIESYQQYAQIIRKIIDKNALLHFDQQAVARLIEYGARISGGKDKISARFGLVMDVAREASYLAKKASKERVGKSDITAALKSSHERNLAPARCFYEMLETGTIIIETSGHCIGQINGLAVAHTANLAYGFPARITATIAPGQAGLINIEGKADLSGQIHTKGFHILGGVLSHLLKPEHPLSFCAAIAFEQSYGGIDGDSASGAETCCLLSALAGVPIYQGLAMTGAIDQFGHIQAIGGVNEKIEGFFDSCQFNGLTGEQGVIMPVANVSDLMLREDIVDACKSHQFHIYAVDHVLDALAILTGTESNRKAFNNHSAYLKTSIMGKARKNAKRLFTQSQFKLA